MGLILITHDLGVVARVADRVCVMYAGQVVEQGQYQQTRVSAQKYSVGVGPGRILHR